MTGKAAAAALMAACGATAGATGTTADDGIAKAYGSLPALQDAALSPDGKQIVLVHPGAGVITVASVLDVGTGAVRAVTSADGKPLHLTYCGWASNDRVVCGLYGLSMLYANLTPWSAVVSVGASGKGMISLARNTGSEAMRTSQFAGSVIDWGDGNGSVLMARDVVAQKETGNLAARIEDGLDVERVDSRTNAGRIIERPNPGATGYLSDGNGTVRIMAVDESHNDQLTGTTAYLYRVAGSREWRSFSRVAAHSAGLRPIAIDGDKDVAYALGSLNGRDALFRVKLDGSLSRDLVYADPVVDVDGVVTVGRRGRVIGYSFTTDRPVVRYFDPAYEALAEKLSRVLPDRPQIEFTSTSADEQRVIVYASGPTHPGHYYLLDRATLHLQDLMGTRPAVEALPPAPVRAITVKAADGTAIPAYLTLPPGAADPRRLPGLVMPHGGPAARDPGGYDDLAQFFAQRGFAVIQPEYRGSTGYGDAFFNRNGFVSWRTAIGDVNDAGRWLVAAGIVDPDKLGIFGWSYGGYAALQSSVLDPALFKAVVAVAPVTDLDMAKEEFRGFTNFNAEQAWLGNATVAREGSPDRHADAFRAPVLMFHGDQDRNVAVAESRAMDAALRHAGKRSELVVYPGLDHQLRDASARTDMLARSDAFFRANLHIATP